MKSLNSGISENILINDLGLFILVLISKGSISIVGDR